MAKLAALGRAGIGKDTLKNILAISGESRAIDVHDIKMEDERYRLEEREREDKFEIPLKGRAPSLYQDDRPIAQGDEAKALFQDSRQAEEGRVQENVDNEVTPLERTSFSQLDNFPTAQGKLRAYLEKNNMIGLVGNKEVMNGRDRRLVMKMMQQDNALQKELHEGTLLDIGEQLTEIEDVLVNPESGMKDDEKLQLMTQKMRLEQAEQGTINALNSVNKALQQTLATPSENTKSIKLTGGKNKGKVGIFGFSKSTGKYDKYLGLDPAYPKGVAGKKGGGSKKFPVKDVDRRLGQIFFTALPEKVKTELNLTMEQFMVTDEYGRHVDIARLRDALPKDLQDALDFSQQRAGDFVKGGEVDTNRAVNQAVNEYSARKGYDERLPRITMGSVSPVRNQREDIARRVAKERGLIK